MISFLRGPVGLKGLDGPGRGEIARCAERIVT
ncbi:hypothetical protein Bravens_01763 [Brevibacterium ravenspurgense]|uniref:Uncharacterized protein n=1 Tax=Brevibacterium ravenspurgense TaxID=479117 RepID=A0A150H5F8_9MICO|nr:hypothetical protein Bravens_01763 [Brevibacterium ravenspurgense]